MAKRITLTDAQTQALAEIIDGTLDSLPEDCSPSEFTLWIDILRSIGHDETADDWKGALEGEGIL